MSFYRFFTIAAAAFFLLTSCGIDKTAGTKGDGNPDKPKVSVGKLDFYPAFESPSGLVTPRNVYVWLPDNYSKGKKYAVLYMSDGQNLFDPEKMFNHQEWQVDEVVGGLLSEGRIQNCIVVGVANSFRTRSQEYFPQDVFDLYSPERGTETFHRQDIFDAQGQGPHLPYGVEHGRPDFLLCRG